MTMYVMGTLRHSGEWLGVFVFAGGRRMADWAERWMTNGGQGGAMDDE